MTTKLILINTDTHAVVPREPSIDLIRESAVKAELYYNLIKAAPQLTTPPVLRWEGGYLNVGNKELAYVWSVGDKWIDSVSSGIFNTEQEARRAAEKVLGFPDGLIIEEV